MNDDLLMELADQGSVSGLLRVIFDHYRDWPKKTPVELFAAEVGIAEIRDFEVEKFVGALVTNEEKSEGAILVKKGDLPARRRFTIGHELGHFLMPSHRGSRQCTRQDLAERRTDTLHHKQESQANEFSAGLLMPKRRFSKDIDDLGSAEAGHILDLARMYGTSVEATANRYVELSDESCAVIMSKDGQVRYARRSGTFPWLSVRSGAPLPSNSAARSSPASITGTPSSWSNVDGGVWLDSQRGTRSLEVLEQTLRQGNGFAITLLLLEDGEFSENDQDEGPRFR